MRWPTHKAIGATTYSLVIDKGALTGDSSFLYGFSVMMGLILSSYISTLPDRLDSLGLDEHRGITHSLLFCLLAGILSFPLIYIKIFEIPIGKPLFLGISLGYLSHIFADFFTDNGISSLKPFLKGRVGIRLWTYRSGEVYEFWLTIVLNLLLIIYWLPILIHALFPISNDPLFISLITSLLTILKDTFIDLFFTFPGILITVPTLLVLLYYAIEYFRKTDNYYE